MTSDSHKKHEFIDLEKKFSMMCSKVDQKQETLNRYMYQLENEKALLQNLQSLCYDLQCKSISYHIDTKIKSLKLRMNPKKINLPSLCKKENAYSM